MTYIANWARKHVAMARLLIGVLHISLLISTIQLIQLLSIAGIHFSITQSILSASAGCSLITFIKFLRKRKQDEVAKRQLQKLRFLLMGICCTLLLAGFFSNWLSIDYSISNSVTAAFTKAEKREKPVYESYADKKAFYKDLKAYYHSLSKKELRKELRHELKNMAKITSTTESVIFAFLIGIAMIAALLGIAALSCSLACNGQGALAILVLIGGLTGIILLCIYLIKLFRKDRQKRNAAELKTSS